MTVTGYCVKCKKKGQIIKEPAIKSGDAKKAY